MNTELIVPLLAAAIQSGTPILYATLGEILTEKSGVLNLGVEGMMITGALAAFITAQVHRKPRTGLPRRRAHRCCHWRDPRHCVPVVSRQPGGFRTGPDDFWFGTGELSRHPAHRPNRTRFQQAGRSPAASHSRAGTILFQQDILVYGAILMVPLLWFFLDKCRWGLNLRAVGEHPEAAAAAGISVLRYRWIGILGGGCLAGFGGAYLSLAYTHLWTNGLSAGRGWIAVALVIFAFWRPERAFLGAYLFGGVMAFQLRLQAVGTHLPSSLLLMLPYLLTVAVLVFSSWKSKQADAPAASGCQYGT